MLLPCRPDGDFHVLPESGAEVHQALDGEGAGAVAHQCGDRGLLDAEDHSGFGLGKAALFDEAVNLKRQPCFQKFLVWTGAPLPNRSKNQRRRKITALVNAPPNSFQSSLSRVVV